VLVHCDAACDLRAAARRNGRGVTALDDASLPRAGTARLALAPTFDDASPWKGRTTIDVQAGPPGGGAATHARVRTKVSAIPPPPFAPPLGVRARRTRAGRVIVTWHTAIPARRVVYLVEARPLGPDLTLERLAFRRGRGRHSFRVVLKPRRPVRRVVVRAISLDPPQKTRTVNVPVSGRRSSP
jgi:hypothetical protein